MIERSRYSKKLDRRACHGCVETLSSHSLPLSLYSKSFLFFLFFLGTYCAYRCCQVHHPVVITAVIIATVIGHHYLRSSQFNHRNFVYFNIAVSRLLCHSPSPPLSLTLSLSLSFFLTPVLSLHSLRLSFRCTHTLSLSLFLFFAFGIS